MRKTIWIVVIFCVIITFISFGLSSAAEKIPTLFNFVWGSSVEDCQANGMESKRAIVDKSTNDHLFLDFQTFNKTIGNIKIPTVIYIFNDNELYSISARIYKYSDFKLLKCSLIKKYGKPPEINDLYNVYGSCIGVNILWQIHDITIDLGFIKNKQNGWLTYSNKQYANLSNKTKELTTYLTKNSITGDL